MKYTFARERWIDETNYSVAFWMLLHVYRGVKINSDEKHAIFVQELTKCVEAQGGIFGHLFVIKPTRCTNLMFFNKTN